MGLHMVLELRAPKARENFGMSVTVGCFMNSSPSVDSIESHR